MRTRRTRRIVLVGLALCALVLVTACGPDAPPPPPSPAAADILARHNYLRGLNGMGGLSVDGAMQANAQFHADRLAAGATGCGSLWHSPELASWYPGVLAGENISCVTGCPTSGEQPFNLWMSSPPHKANILRPEFTDVGIATSCNGAVMMVVAQYRS